MQASSTGLGNVIEAKVIRELPLQGRNFTALLLLTPGVNPVSTAQGPGANGGGELALGTEGNSGLPGSSFLNASIQGQQNRSKVYYVDGIINTSVRAGTYVALPDLDALQEFKVESQSDKAEFGGVTGGVVNMTSKTGTNRYSGSVFGFFRSEQFGARNPFRDANSDKPAEFSQKQFGSTMGGPIIRNKTFFFGSYDGWRYRDTPDQLLTIPAGPELDGDFSHTYHGRTIYNPFTTRVENGRLVRDPFPNNIIPRELISPTMQAFLKAYMPTPTIAGNVANNFRQFRDEDSNSNAFQVRVDHHFSGNDNLFFRWTERRINNFQPIGDKAFKTPDSINRNYGGGWFHAFSNNKVLEVRAGVATQPTEDAPSEHDLGVGPQQGLSLPELQRFYGYVIIGTSLRDPWSNMPDLGVQGPRERQNPNWNAAADMSWLEGRHNMKFGFQMLRISRLQTNQFGSLDFSAEATRNPQNTSATGDPIASALLGLSSRIRGNVVDQGYIDFHTSTLSGYFQDQWALKPNLTLNYGLRYDYVTRVIGNYGFQSGPDMDTGEWLIGLEETPPVCSGQAPPCLPSSLSQIPFNQFIKVTGERDAILKPIRDNFGPRLGVAWQINERSVLRSGYSLLWDSMVSRSQYGQHQYESWGWPQFSGIDTGAINVEGGQIQRLEDFRTLPFASPRAAPWNSDGFYNDPDRKNAYSHQWHVEYQRELTRNLMAAVAYVGSYNGRMEYAGRPQAPKDPAVDASGRRLTAAERDLVRPWPQLNGTFTYSTDIGMSRYNALQVKTQHRFSEGLSSLVSYTWSRSVDTSSGWFNAEGGLGGAATVQNFYDMDGNRAISSYDVPHILTWGTVWELPVGTGKRWVTNGAPAAILGGWQLNWILLARSGQPFTPTVGGDPANLGYTGYARPNLVGDPEVDNPNVNQWFNPAAFAVPVNSFGDAGRNILRGPAFWNVDLGLQRNVRIGNTSSLQLRLEVFNVFNNINLNLTQASVAIDNPANVGRITTMTGTPRQVQFGLRLVY